MMDESSLENALAGYQSQLDHISQMIKEADTMEKLELYDIEKDMKELIQVTQEQLLSLKKENLIKTLYEGEIDKRSTTSPSNQSPSNQLQSQSHVTSSSIKTEGESTKNELVNSDDVNALFHNYVGTKCRVRYTQSWGSFQSHNAIILSIEEVTQTDDIDLDVKVRVLFLNPTHKEMVPCRYFMDGECNYAEENCRFSHGHIVTVDDLEEYVEPDFKDVEVGSKVLAKHIDGVWHPAVIQDVHEEKFIISFDTKRKASLVTVDLHEVFPIGAGSDTSGNESEFSLQSDSDDDDMSISSDDEAPATLADACKTQRVDSDFGVWEEHTRGIGSKLMAKMGYIIGKGLGKNSEGRIEPVEINLLPAGKSLDKIAELREKGRIKDPTKRNRKKVLQKIEIGLEKQKKERAAFDLIDQLTKKQTGSNNLKDHHSKGKFSVEDSYKQMKKSLHQQKQGDVREKQKPSSCSLNVQVLKNNEKIKNLKKRLVKLKESLARNPGDTSISRTIQNNLNQTQHELDQLIALDNSLQTKINMKQQSRKLTVF